MPAQQAFLFTSILYPSQIQVLYSLLLYDTNRCNSIIIMSM